MSQLTEYESLLKGHLGELAASFNWYHKYKSVLLVPPTDIETLAQVALKVKHAMDLYQQDDAGRAVECLNDIQW